RDRNLEKTLSSWHINLSKPKSSSFIVITSIVREHNHQMEPNIVLFAPKYRKLLPEILELIEFYVTKGNLGTKQILSLLAAKFPEYMIHKHDIYNIVHKFRTPP
ncbi:9564_t:CDS:1, partial [Gigaspora rosea]